jgi:hypothetical protein
MFTLLSICLVLHPICIDETIYSHLREKYADRMLKMQKGYCYEFLSSLDVLLVEVKVTAANNNKKWTNFAKSYVSF